MPISSTTPADPAALPAGVKGWPFSALVLALALLLLVPLLLALRHNFNDDERRINHSAEALAMNLAQSAFLANMSHEIGTPMNAILGMAHLLRRSGVTPVQAERLDKIDAATRHLLGTISDILDLSKIAAGKFFLEAEPLTIASLMGNVWSILTERAQSKNLELKIETSAFPANLHGDPARL